MDCASTLLPASFFSLSFLFVCTDFHFWQHDSLTLWTSLICSVSERAAERKIELFILERTTDWDLNASHKAGFVDYFLWCILSQRIAQTFLRVLIHIQMNKVFLLNFFEYDILFVCFLGTDKIPIWSFCCNLNLF